MSNYQPFQRRLPLLLACLSFCACAFVSTCLPAQRAIRQTTQRAVRQTTQRAIRQTYPAPTFRQPYQGTVTYPPQGTVTYPSQGTVTYPSQGTPVYPQQFPSSGNGQIIIPNQQGTVVPAPPVRQQIQPRSPSADYNSIVKENQELKERVAADVKNYNAIVKENQELKERVSVDAKQVIQLTQGNDQLKQRVEQLDGAFKTVTTEFSEAKLEISELRKTVEASGSAQPDMNGLNATLQQQKNEIDQFSVRYEQTVKQREVLASQVESLTEENSGLRSELDNLRSAGGSDMNNLQTQFAEKSTRLNELEQAYGAAQTESERLQSLAENANAANVRLTEQVGLLSSSNEQLGAQLHASLAAAKSVSTPIEETSASMPSKFVSSQRSNTTDLTAQNRQLLAINKKTETENELLSQRILDLEGAAADRTIENKDTEASAAALSINSLRAMDSDESKFSIMHWLIPFLGIGLAVALYVFITEEDQGTLVTDTKRLKESS